MNTDLKYVLEFGIDAGGNQRCALEVGQFTDIDEAKIVADAARGRLVYRAESDNQGAGYSVDPYDREDGDDQKPITGATLNVYTDAEGTIEAIDLY